MKLSVIVTALTVLALVARAEVQEVAHYNLKGLGGIRDTAAPEVWKSVAPGGPDLVRKGDPKIMSNGPESRRSDYDSSIMFNGVDQCYQGPKALANGDNFVVEAWVYAKTANSAGYHAVIEIGRASCRERVWQYV